MTAGHYYWVRLKKNQRLAPLLVYFNGLNAITVGGTVIDISDIEKSSSPIYPPPEFLPAEFKQSGADWQRHDPEIVVLEAQGWPEPGSWYDESITYHEYVRRRALSTILTEDADFFDAEGQRVR